MSIGQIVQLGTDKHIVKVVKNISVINEDWLSQVKWNNYAEDGSVSTSTGVYVICDNGYISWPTTICPFMKGQTNSPLKDDFSTTLESLRKDGHLLIRDSSTER